MSEKINVIQESKNYLNDNLAYWANDLAESKLKRHDFLVKNGIKNLMINKFLLNLVEAYEPNIEKYIKDDIEKIKGE